MTDRKKFTAALLSACLLSLVELLIDESAKGWRSLTRKIRAFILFHAGITETQPHLRSSVYWFARISNATRAICFGENLPLPLSSMTCVKLETLRYPTSQISISARVEENIELLAIYLESWARVQSWSIYWVKKSEELYSKDNCSKTHISSCPALGKTYGKLPSEHITLGIEIICSASRLQRAIITTILSYVDTPVSGIQPAILSLLPYYQWSLAGLSRQFDHPAWSSLGCSLPIMHNDLIHQQAIQAFEFAEESLRSTDFEALLYIPIMNVVGFEMQTEQERTRVLEFVATLKTKGFAVAGKVERDLKTAWVGKMQ
ncbi:hypothetical protein BDV23DRAFT_168258 [Aspergillus alliaceus]|uniref:Uncharacterized protein n=1 Tax=Petromyces alliaceus TaxID=209559 RepID=A0A5N7CQG0_PETAA|nr:hypothetical protein BDV23DRAFT_168258 [Aspergillus alliaceus]